jgi:hypothetical protein
MKVLDYSPYLKQGLELVSLLARFVTFILLDLIYFSHMSFQIKLVTNLNDAHLSLRLLHCIFLTSS